MRLLLILLLLLATGWAVTTDIMYLPATNNEEWTIGEPLYARASGLGGYIAHSGSFTLAELVALRDLLNVALSGITSDVEIY